MTKSLTKLTNTISESDLVLDLFFWVENMLALGKTASCKVVRSKGSGVSKNLELGVRYIIHK